MFYTSLLNMLQNKSLTYDFPIQSEGMQPIFSWNQLLFRKSQKRSLICNQTYCIYNVAFSKNHLNTKVSQTKTFTKMTTTMMMMIKPWLVWNGERKFTWPFTNYEGRNDPEPEKIQNGNRTGLTFARTGRNALSIKLLERRPLWRSFQGIALRGSFPLSCLYPQFKV